MAIIDHLGLTVSSLASAKAFFAAALAPLGIVQIVDTHGWVGFGRPPKPDFWFGEGHGAVQGAMHIAFTAQTREQVRQFYAAALAAGGKDNGPPGIRAHYHPNYYGAFVIGPDGHNVEAVCHAAEA